MARASEESLKACRDNTKSPLHPVLQQPARAGSTQALGNKMSRGFALGRREPRELEKPRFTGRKLELRSLPGNSQYRLVRICRLRSEAAPTQRDACHTSGASPSLIRRKPILYGNVKNDEMMMIRPLGLTWVVLMLAGCIALAACGGGGSAMPAPTHSGGGGPSPSPSPLGQT